MNDVRRPNSLPTQPSLPMLEPIELIEPVEPSQNLVDEARSVQTSADRLEQLAQVHDALAILVAANPNAS
jgi:hypothetical protein